MARKKKAEEHANHERWLVSYADFITLLFAFFVTMYGSSAVDAGKYKVLSQSLKASFMSPYRFNSTTKDTIDMGLNMGVKIEILPQLFADRNQGTYKYVQNTLRTLEEDGSATVVPETRGVVVRLADRAIFNQGEDELLPAAERILDQVAETLKEEESLIRIEGHTDNVPIQTAQFPSNWELSSSRAVNVLRYLVDKHGVKANKLSALGFGEYRPVADNGTSEGRAKNRRIDIVILSEEGSEYEPR